MHKEKFPHASAKGEPIEADALADLIESEAEEDAAFKANWTGTWDRNDAGETAVVEVNRGHGPEEAIEVTSENEAGRMTRFVYVGPFLVETMPDEDTMLTFHCTGAIAIIDLGGT